MKPTIILLPLLAWLSSATGQSIEPHDKGWMAFYTGDQCQMGRRVDHHSLQNRDLAVSISIIRDPHERSAPTLGQTLLSISLFAKEKPLAEPVESVTVVAGSRSWVLEPFQVGMRYLVGESADAVRAAFLQDNVTIKVGTQDGSSVSFAVRPKGFKVANSTFEACVAELLLNNPLQPNAR